MNDCYIHIRHGHKVHISIGPYSRKAAVAKLKELLAYHQTWHALPRADPPPLCVIKIERSDEA